MFSFRSLLERRESAGETKLFSVLADMEESARNTWQSQLGEDRRGSYTGIPHARNVEEHLNRAVPDSIKETFSCTEIFTLLAAVLLHDIGKLATQDSPDHAFVSCTTILEQWALLRIPSARHAHWIAALACSHTWDAPNRPPGCDRQRHSSCDLECNLSHGLSELNVLPNASDGPVRLKWLATLLRLADEVDDQEGRVVPQWLHSKSNPSSSRSWRRLITSVVFDVPGRCVKLRTRTIGSPWTQKDIEDAQHATAAVDGVLKRWREPLQEMGLPYDRCFVECFLPVPALISGDDLCLPTPNRKIGCAVEPSLRPHMLSRIAEAMTQLDHAVIGMHEHELFPWDSLAEEAVVSDLGLVRLAAARIGALRQCINHNSPDGAEYVPAEPFADKHYPEVVCAKDGWRLRRPNDLKPHGSASGAPTSGPAEDRVISTGIRALDDLLFPEYRQPGFGFEWGGVYAPVARSKTLSRWLSPIIVVEGSTGLGKSTLALQVLCHLAGIDGRSQQSKEPMWTCLYYSLEQSGDRVKQLLRGHRLFRSRASKNSRQVEHDLETKVCDLANTAWYSLDAASLTSRILLPRLTPCQEGLAGRLDDGVFARRYTELRRTLQWLTSMGVARQSFCCLDSLVAFSDRPLTRGQVNLLFSLFREHEVPLLVTLESKGEEEESSFHAPTYLADVVIRLDVEERDKYYRETIEVRKTRYNRRILGKHLMKLKSPDQQATSGFDDRVGVVVYSSLDHHLVASRSRSRAQDPIRLAIPHGMIPIGLARSDGTQTIERDTCIVISGPMGGHKFAIAVNLLLGDDGVDDKRGERLIVSLSEEREMKLENVALLDNLKRWRGHLKIAAHDQSDDSGKKVCEQTNKPKTLRILNFRLGKIMPEEFLYLFERYLDDHPRVERVLFADTAQLRTRFPLLQQEELFLPAMIEILKSRSIYSIFIDATKQNIASQTLLAAADCRIFIERSPTKIGERLGGNTLRVDNVREKDYDRQPRGVSAGKAAVLVVEDLTEGPPAGAEKKKVRKKAASS